MVVYTQKQEWTAIGLGITGFILMLIGFSLGPLVYLLFFIGIAFMIPIINIFLTQTSEDESEDIKPPFKRRR